MKRIGGLSFLVLSLITINLTGSASTGAASSFVRPNNLSPGNAPKGSVDLGAVPDGQSLSLNVVLPPSNAPQLEALLQNLNDPSSPEYHHWLRAGQFDSEFGPSASSIAAVESWLHEEGLTSTTASGFTVRVTGTVGAASTALGTTFERYKSGSGHAGYLARNTPLVPQSLASGQIQAIIGLNTIDQFQPEGDPSGSVAHVAGPGLRPNADGLTSCAGANSEAGPGYYTLDELGAGYGIGSLLSDGQDGQGETIGLYELASHSPSDVAAYENCFGLTNTVSTVPVDGGGGTVGGDGSAEADIDIEQAATQAPDASIISYEGPNGSIADAYDVWNAIVGADAAQVISTSWGECEPQASGNGTVGSFTTLFEKAAAQGQTVLAAAGDQGSEGCYAFNSSTAEEVDYPASDPAATAVGGTFRYSNGEETAWNNCESDESTSCAEGYGDAAAGGGGMSRYEQRPSDQPDILDWPTAQPCGESCREVPDISANAGAGMVYYTDGAWAVSAGTSFAAPFLAGLVADHNDGCTTTTGLWTTALYALYDEGGYGTAFNDITSGNTDMTGSNGGQYPATTGYDAATGIGSPIAAGLSCPEITSVSGGYSGAEVTIAGLGLEHATISFGGSSAQVVSATATQATVVVPSGSGTVTVSGTSVLGTGSQTSSFTYGTPPAPSPPSPSPSPTSVSPPSVQHGYWLVGSDGGIFTFGSAQFYGSTGSLHLQRPVVGITPTGDRGGYWLVASDGGIFSFGDAGFYGSIPGLGLHPAGSGLPNSLDAPIVAMVPSFDGGGYFMVASDGGVFAFGNAKFAGSCPGIGGCSGSAVAVMPDATGNGYWLVTNTGHVYDFGNAAYYGQPGPQSVPVTSAVRTPDGNGYWILFANGAIGYYGDAPVLGGPAGLGGLDFASAIFATADGDGYWVASSTGQVFHYGDAPNDGSMAGTKLNGAIIAGTGW